MRVIQIVNSSYGVRNAIGARPMHVARQLSPDDQLIVLARSATEEAREEYDIRQCGLSPLLGRVLKATNVYVWRRFPHKAILQRRFVADASRWLRSLPIEEFDVIHTWAGIPGVVAEAKRRNPRLVVIRDVSMRPECATPDVGPSADDTVQRDGAAVDYFLAPSQIVARAMVERCGIERERIYTEPFGVDVELFKPNWLTGDRRGGKPFSVAFSGSLDRRKGIPELLAAWNNLRFREAELHLYGRVYPEVKSYLKGARSRGVYIHGFVDLSEELTKHDLFVLPSQREGSAKSVYEALACGLPVVTTVEAGSVVRSGVEGLIVPAGDVGALVGAIRYYYENPEAREEAATAARARAKEYTWERYGHAVAEVYRNAADRGPWKGLSKNTDSGS